MLSNMFVWFGVLASFALGYLIGRVDSIATALSSRTEQPPSFLKAAKLQTQPRADISIDDTKYVAPISTAGLSRTGGATTIGKTTQTQDDIQTSVSKLAQLKGK